MKNIALADLLESSRSGYWGKDPGESDTDVDVIRNGDIKPSGIRWGTLPVRSLRLREVEKSRVRVSDVLLTTSGDCGQTAMIMEEPTRPTCATNFVRVLRFDPMLVEARYAYHFLASHDFRSAISPYVRGTTLQNLSTRDAFANVAIPLPALDEQRRMVAILDRADAMRATRRRMPDWLDAMESAWFAQKFADTARARRRIGDHIVEQRVGLDRRASAQGADRAHEYVKMDAITTRGRVDVSSLTRVDASPEEVEKYSLADGDLLMNTRNSRELVGKTAVYRGGARLYNNNIMRIRLDDGLLPDFVNRYLWSREGQAQLEARKSGTTSVFAMYGKAFFDVEVPVPPRDEQQEFATLVATLDRQRQVVERALHAHDELFASLRARAFRGEL